MLLLPPGDVEGPQLVGAGGFGLVYRGWSRTLRMEIALKMIQGSHGCSLNKLMRDLKKEGDIMQKASNPYVLQLLGVYEKPEGNLIEHGLVMEYMTYGSLRSLFDDIPDVPWALRFQILHQVALGMNYLHCLDPPIIHRDLKPSNVLLSRHLDIKITDFGLSKIVGATSTKTPSIAGTWAYMAPEALNDINYHPTKSYDVYSYGILIWTVFSTEEPYPGIPTHIIERCVSKGQRPKDSLLDQYKDVNMVPEAKELMIRCWNQIAENRPSFNDCSESTAVMFEAYTNEVVDAVRRVQDFLYKMSSEDQSSEANETLRNSSFDMEKLIQDLENARVSENSTHEDHKDDNVRQIVAGRSQHGSLGRMKKKREKKRLQSEKTLPVPSVPSEDIHKKDNISTQDYLMNNIATAIKRSGDYKKIRNRSVSPETSSPDIVDTTDFLQTNLPQIVQAKPDLRDVLDVLLSKCTITQEEFDTITLGSVQEQVRKTLHIIINKGQESCKEFLQLMNHLHPELMTSLTLRSGPA